MVAMASWRCKFCTWCGGVVEPLVADDDGCVLLWQCGVCLHVGEEEGFFVESLEVPIDRKTE